MENKKLPTAKEFFNNFCNKRTRVGQLNETERLEVMIEFAKLHVIAALKEASENAAITNKAKFKGDWNPQIDQESILNSYSLKNIK